MKKKRPFHEKRLQEQLRTIFLTSIILLLVLFLVSFSVVVLSNFRRQSEHLAGAQVHTFEQTCSGWLSNVRRTAITLNINQDVQAYYRMTEAGGAGAYYERAAAVANTIGDAINMNSDISFLAVVNPSLDRYVYHGVFASNENERAGAYRDGIARMVPAAARGALSYVFVHNALNRNEDAFIMFHPVFSTQKVGKRLGMLAFYLNAETLLDPESFRNTMITNMMLADADGRIITSALPTDRTRLDLNGSAEGHLRFGTKEIFYEKLPQWHFYVLCELDLRTMLRPMFRTAALIVGIALTLGLFVSVATRRVVGRTLKPLNTVVDAMHRVQQEDIDYRIRTGSSGEDLRALEEGYNSMMDTIDTLVDRVQKEQHQMEQIHLNALQSQIQPHFLYNTLDCIHWQARLEGDRETSMLVGELAAYYRICLSKGRDIIPLSQELEQVRLYIEIQKKRYGDIIQYQVSIPENLSDMLIPKLTLQPLVENSIYHGIRVKEGKKGTILISAREDADGTVSITRPTTAWAWRKRTSTP